VRGEKCRIRDPVNPVTQSDIFIRSKKKGLVMKKICFLLATLMTAPALAGDLWEIVSTSVGPDGNPQPFTERRCLPKDGLDPSRMLGDLGSCAFDKKIGSASAMTFSMTCKIPGMSSELGSMTVAGDARLNGDRFKMRYTITVGGDQSLPGGNFSMTGNLEARKIGQCSDS
jgi:hypothetical protein